MVEVEKFECEDCRAIELERTKFHKANGHPGDPGDSCKECTKHIFYISERIPIDQFKRR